MNREVMMIDGRSIAIAAIVIILSVISARADEGKSAPPPPAPVIIAPPPSVAKSTKTEPSPVKKKEMPKTTEKAKVDPKPLEKKDSPATVVVSEEPLLVKSSAAEDGSASKRVDAEAAPVDDETKRIQKAVEEYLKAQEQAKKSEEELKKAAEADAGYEVGTDLSMKATWKHGLEITSPNNDFRIHVGGRTQFDTVWMAADRNVQFGSTDPVGAIENGVDFRRGRLRVDGVMYEVVEFAVEYDFFNTVNVEPFQGGPNTTFADNLVSNVPAPTDLWFAIHELPTVGTFRVGNFKEPIGFEHNVSSRFLPFLERSFNQDAFTGPFNNGFSPGIMINNYLFDKRVSWWLGEFKNTQNVFAFDTDNDAYATTARITGLPVYENDGRCLLHLGLGASYRKLDNDQVRVRTRTATRPGPGTQWPIIGDSGVIRGSDEDQLDAEMAAVWGPLNLQGEWFLNWIDSDNNGRVFFQGAYIEVMYFLTGEHRIYSKEKAVFDRVIPNENFFFVKGKSRNLVGKGAWQVGARYNFLDLTDSGINGGRLNGWTLGLNWFLNPNMKIQFNYDVTYRDSTDGDNDGAINGIGVRVAHDF